MPHDHDDLTTIRRRLHRLRLGLRLWQFGVGASRVVGVLAVFVLLSLALDRSMRLDQPQRRLALLVGVAGLALLAWRGIVRPLRRPVSAATLLRRVERRRPELQDRLVAAWELATLPQPPPGASPALVAATIRQGWAATRDTDFRGVLDWPRFWRRTRLGALAAAALLLLALAAPHTMRLWFSRNILLSDAHWPRQTHLHVHGLVAGGLSVPVAGDLELLVRATGRQPDELVLRYADESGAAYTERLPRVGDGYRTVFRDVTAPFRLQVSGGDDRTAWLAVRLLPRPELLDLTVTIEPPAYTGRQPTTVAAQPAVVVVPAGSGIVLSGRASLPWREIAVASEHSRLPTLGAGDATTFAIRLPPAQVKTATYRLQAIATSGVPARHPTPVSLRVEPDRPPRVTAALDGIGQLVLPGAVVPVVGELQDDYGVTAAWLEYQSQSPTAGDRGAVRVPLPLPPPPPAGGATRFGHALELAPLQLGPDTSISLHVGARDGNPLTGPGQGQSASLTLRVVSAAELRRDLVRREQLLRQRLERLLQEQAALADESQLFAAGAPLDQDQGAWRARQAERRQQQVAPALAAIVADLAQLRAETTNNRLEPEPAPLRQRLDDHVLEPLRAVAATLLPAAADRVTTARQLPATAPRAAAWRDAERAQRLVTDALTAVRQHLLAAADVSELLRLMEELVDDQKKVNRETGRRAAGAIESIFEQP